MKALLMLAGYSAHQASCLAPVLWFLVVAAVVYIVTGAVGKGGRFGI